MLIIRIGKIVQLQHVLFAPVPVVAVVASRPTCPEGRITFGTTEIERVNTMAVRSPATILFHLSLKNGFSERHSNISLNSNS